MEHPFAALKYHIFGHPRFLLRGRKGAQTEISLAAMVYNLKRMLRVRNPLAGRSGILTIAVHSSNNKKAMSRFQNIASFLLLGPPFRNRLDVWAAFLLHPAKVRSGNCRNQAFTQRLPACRGWGF